MRKATKADCVALARDMRAADALEVNRSSSLPLEAVLVEALAVSEGGAEVLLFDGELASMFGIVKPDAITPYAVPWLLTTAVVEKHRTKFFKIAKVVVDRWAAENPILLQMVDDEYEGAKGFLQRLGFKLHPPVPHGPFGAPFRPALRTRNV